MHVKRLFHVIVKHWLATETSVDCQPRNIGRTCGLPHHRTEILYFIFSCFVDFERGTFESDCILFLAHLWYM